MLTSLIAGMRCDEGSAPTRARDGRLSRSTRMNRPNRLPVSDSVEATLDYCVSCIETTDKDTCYTSVIGMTMAAQNYCYRIVKE